MKKLLLTLLFVAVTPLSVLAEDNIPVKDLLGNGSEDVKALEEKRTEEIENALKISMPEYTDNPSHIITFVDPSEEKKGVELDIDEQGYKKINSPYSLPQLSIGEHHLKFRFVDSIGATKVLEYDLIVIPRPPLIKAPTFDENNLALSGTGLANGEVILTVSIDANNYTQVADIDTDGNWNTSIPMESVSDGIYTIFGYTRKDGYASNPSEPTVFEYGNDGVEDIKKSNDSIITFSDIPTVLTQNPDLIVFSVSLLLLGALVTSIVFILTRSSKSNREEKEISEKMKKSKKEKTLLELFGAEKEDKKEDKKGDRKEKKERKKSKSKKKKENKKEKTFTKHDFLKDFKNFDPDKDSGKEKKEPSKKEKKDVIITLTSKKEDN
jgi:hypothetical protein